MKVVNESQVEGVLNDILKDVAKAADQLEENIGDNAFDDAMLDPHLVSSHFIIYLYLKNDKCCFSNLFPCVKPKGR